MSTATTAAKKAYSVVLLEGDTLIGEGLQQYFSQYYTNKEAEVAVTCLSAKSLLLKEAERLNPDLIILNLDPDYEGNQPLVKQLKQLCPTVQFALWSEYQLEELITFMKETGITTVLTKKVPFDLDDFARSIENLLEPERSFGLERYMAGIEQSDAMTLKSSTDIMTAFERLRALFEEVELANENEMLTALMEAITNAIYHAPATEQGKNKYKKGEVIETLEPHEFVELRWAISKEQLGIQVTDQFGRLTKEQVLYWMERNLKGANLLDTSGRGIYLMHTLADHFSLNVRVGERTEIVMVHARHEASPRERLKPFYVNVR